MTIEIRQATATDRIELLRLFARSQEATRIPDPDTYPSTELEGFLYNPRIYDEYRYIAVSRDLGQIVGHSAIEQPNPLHIPLWLSGVTSKANNPKLAELSGLFVDPDYLGQGIAMQLLDSTLNIVRRKLGATPVSATWIYSKYNKQIRIMFERLGGVYVCEDTEHLLDLFIFE